MTSSGLTLRKTLGLEEPGQLVAIVGGGGKTSLLFKLADELTGRIITTTTTRIFSAQIKLSPAVCRFHDPAFDQCIRESLDQVGQCLVVGEVEGEKANGVPEKEPGRWLHRLDVDYVLVEADGSRMRPCKAPADHEPVIPKKSNLVIPVAGIDAIGGIVSKVAHRPEQVSRLTGLAHDDVMTTGALAALLRHPDGGLKSVPKKARVVVFINKVESLNQLLAARDVAGRVLEEDRIQSVVIGAIKAEIPVIEHQQRVTAVVLAAGESERMGQTKQLLPWGDTTILGQVLRNLKRSKVNNIVVVTGNQEQRIASVAREHDIQTIHNSNYQTGEMLSSLKVAVDNLGSHQQAVLAVLADQPMVGPQVYDQLLEAYWQGKGDLIAPSYQGRRGNPVLIGHSFFPDLLALDPSEAPRSLLRANPEKLVLIPVGSAAIFRDVDTPEQYQRWRPG